MPTLYVHSAQHDAAPADTLPLGSAHAFSDIVVVLDGDDGVVSALVTGWDEDGAELTFDECVTLASRCDAAVQSANDETVKGVLARLAETLRSVPPEGCAVIA